MKNNINLNLYKTFYEVAKHGSISLAAKKTFMSQPAISKSIKKLEEELGTPLFYRTLNGSELTEKGQALFFYVEEAFNNFLIGERIMFEDDNLQSGKLSIGVPSQIGSFFLFQNIAEFHRQYPNIEITLISKGTRDLLQLLESHEIDFVIDTAPIVSPSLNLTVEPIKDVSNVFVCSKEFYENNIVDLSDIKNLNNYPLILPIAKTANRRGLDSYLLNKNIEISNVLNIHTSEMIVAAIKEGLGIGYVIKDLVEEQINNGDFILLPIEDLPVTSINLVYNKNYLTAAPLYFIKKYIKEDISI